MQAQWHPIGLQLDVPDSQLQNIRTTHGHLDQSKCMIEMLSFWLKSTPGASWDDIIAALKKENNESLANKLKAKYLGTGICSVQYYYYCSFFIIIFLGKTKGAVLQKNLLTRHDIATDGGVDTATADVCHARMLNAACSVYNFWIFWALLQVF